MVYVVKNITILGSTGSIGKSTLDVIDSLKKDFSIYALSCHRNISLFYNQVIKYNPRYAVITDSESYNEFINIYGKNINNTEIIFGNDGLDFISSNKNTSIVLVAIVGFSCLKSVISAIKSNKTILLANKEILVGAGEMIISLLKKSSAILLPIDSEHNALLQIILSSGLEYKINDNKYYKSKFNKLIITASGGPFIDLKIKDLKDIKPKDAIKHPTWSMGKKISVDSSTMMNKGLEIIEAKILFNIDLKKINALVHRQSKVHALVEFIDGTVITHMSKPDMKIPISYALTYPNRIYKTDNEDFSYNNLTFEDLSLDRFPCYKLARDVAENGKNTGLILNAANEISVEYFLEERILYTDIPNIIEEVLNANDVYSHSSIESILENDKQIRQFTMALIKSKYS